MLDDRTELCLRRLSRTRNPHPVSKLETIELLDEIGVSSASDATVNRRLPGYAKNDWRQRLAAACAGHVRLGPATLVLYDVTTGYFEADQGDGFREPGSPRNAGLSRRSPSGY